MQDDSQRRTIEVHLPRVLAERIRLLGSERERSASAIVEESLETFFAKLPAERAGSTR